MGEEEKDTLGKIFMERFRSGSGRSLGSSVATFLWREREENEGVGQNGIGGTLMCPTGASEGDTLCFYVVCPPTSSWIARVPLSLVPYYAPRVPRWMALVLWSRYGKSFFEGLFVKKVFEKG
jgi:hypothetical protein